MSGDGYNSSLLHSSLLNATVKELLQYEGHKAFSLYCNHFGGAINQSFTVHSVPVIPCSTSAPTQTLICLCGCMSRQPLRAASPLSINCVRSAEVPAATFQRLVVALVHSGQACGNGILVGIPAQLMRRPTTVGSKCSGTADLQHETLHWLRITGACKITALSYKAPHIAPRYLGPFTRVTDMHGRRAPTAWTQCSCQTPPSAAELFRLPTRRSGIYCQRRRFGTQFEHHQLKTYLFELSLQHFVSAVAGTFVTNT